MDVDHRSFVEGSLLYFAGGGGRHDVSGLENDADDFNGSAAAANDEAHAHFVCGDVSDFPVFQRAVVIHSYQQLGRHWTAVVFKSRSSSDAGSEAGAKQKVILLIKSAEKRTSKLPWPLNLSTMANWTAKQPPQPCGNSWKQ